MEVMGKLSHKYLESKAHGNTRHLLIPGKTKLHKEDNIIIVYFSSMVNNTYSHT